MSTSSQLAKTYTFTMADPGLPTLNMAELIALDGSAIDMVEFNASDASTYVFSGSEAFDGPALDMAELKALDGSPIDMVEFKSNDASTYVISGWEPFVGPALDMSEMKPINVNLIGMYDVTELVGA